MYQFVSTPLYSFITWCLEAIFLMRFLIQDHHQTLPVEFAILIVISFICLIITGILLFWVESRLINLKHFGETMSHAARRIGVLPVFQINYWIIIGLFLTMTIINSILYLI